MADKEHEHGGIDYNEYIKISRNLGRLFRHPDAIKLWNPDLPAGAKLHVKTETLINEEWVVDEYETTNQPRLPSE